MQDGKQEEKRGAYAVGVSAEQRQCGLQPWISPDLFPFPKLGAQCCNDEEESSCCVIFAESFSQKYDTLGNFRLYERSFVEKQTLSYYFSSSTALVRSVYAQQIISRF